MLNSFLFILMYFQLSRWTSESAFGDEGGFVRWEVSCTKTRFHKSKDTLAGPATFLINKQLTSDFILKVSITYIPWGHPIIDVPLCNSHCLYPSSNCILGLWFCPRWLSKPKFKILQWNKKRFANRKIWGNHIRWLAEWPLWQGRITFRAKWGSL